MRALAIALALALAATAAGRAGSFKRRALELELREGLVEQLEDDLARLSDALRARRFEEALLWFDAPCDAPPVIGGRSRADRPDPFTARVRHEPEGGVRVGRGADAVAPLIALLKEWLAVAHVRFEVLDAAFWPSGLTETFGPFRARTAHRLVEGTGTRQ